ncbi:MAG: hypothetical protein OEP48_07720 [Betaproteobacteria bacterium]|nr:hypothetical protein [Betaproteobacteria bacterium]MDH3438121.1 hypothetical protein [Betaproteobacteria bacterium]
MIDVQDCHPDAQLAGHAPQAIEQDDRIDATAYAGQKTIGRSNDGRQPRRDAGSKVRRT